MEIQPSRQRQPDHFGPLSPRIAPGPEGLDRLPVRHQSLPLAAHAADARPITPWTDNTAPDAPTWTTAGRAAFAPVRRLRRPVLRRQVLVWWERWLLAALSLTFRLERWWRRRQRKYPWQRQQTRRR
ncbi:hypothetical protein [Ectopseudomonas oleovorans]|uniref:hypothetical protein n=1 Tax=Ectopseudomonas oleovorans TaxID=301 RepID=UPI000F7B7446|nr:hypothetical protein [Pseudomonas oleovorans]